MTIRDETTFIDKYWLTQNSNFGSGPPRPGRKSAGSGNGRNSLYLAANGFDVTAWDKTR